ncbi:MAG: hypothetical protein GY757_09145 [bacterium]|nr:hypothetical protein [bacterium]
MQTVSIRMFKTHTGSSDGISIRDFQKGETYRVSLSLAQTFVEVLKVAEYHDEMADAYEKFKAMQGAPENKVVTPSLTCSPLYSDPYGDPYRRYPDGNGDEAKDTSKPKKTKAEKPKKDKKTKDKKNE